MPVPDFQTLMLPVLQSYADGAPRRSRDARDRVAATQNLSAEELGELLPSGRQTRFGNRIAWGHGYLKNAGLLESPQRGVYQITPRGREVLARKPERIDIAFLDQFPEFVEFRSRAGTQPSEKSEDSVEETVTKTWTPDEQIRIGYQQHQAALASQLLERIKQASPEFFEQLVVKLLVAMGYGGTEADAARVVGRSGDGGIDGIIKEDRLGFDSIYVQAKRWEATVGRPTIQQFAGALQGQRARKGTVITTSSFSRDAIDYAATLQSTIVLIDGVQLAQLMIEYEVGVTETDVIRLKRIDEDYFEEE